MKILVCSDGGGQAERAVRFIAPVASYCQAHLTLCGIAENPADEKPLLDTLRRHAQILRDQGVNVDLATKLGQAVEEIQEQIKADHYDMVVIGAVRKGSAGSFCMSAKAYRIIKVSHPPILVVIGERPRLKQILICSGGRGYIDSAIALTGQILRKEESSVTLLHVTPGTPPFLDDLRTLRQDAETLLASKSALGRQLSRQKASLEKLGIRADVRVRQGFVVEEIFKEINAGDYDMIVTGSTPSSGPLRTYVIGDVTSEIVNNANCPVLVVPGDTPEGSFFQRLRRFFGKPAAQ